MSHKFQTKIYLKIFHVFSSFSHRKVLKFLEDFAKWVERSEMTEETLPRRNYNSTIWLKFKGKQHPKRVRPNVVTKNLSPNVLIDRAMMKLSRYALSCKKINTKKVNLTFVTGQREDYFHCWKWESLKRRKQIEYLTSLSDIPSMAATIDKNKKYEIYKKLNIKKRENK